MRHVTHMKESCGAGAVPGRFNERNASSNLQYVAMCCSMLQCVAVCCNVLQSVAMCCSLLQCVAVCCNVLQYVAMCCSMLQCVAVCCNVLQCRAEWEKYGICDVTLGGYSRFFCRAGAVLGRLRGRILASLAPHESFICVT